VLLARVLDSPSKRECFGSKTDAFFTQFTGFSICHPMYDDRHMLKAVQHATATVLLE
jgi:hypothetical protein